MNGNMGGEQSIGDERDESLEALKRAFRLQGTPRPKLELTADQRHALVLDALALAVDGDRLVELTNAVGRAVVHREPSPPVIEAVGLALDYAGRVIDSVRRLIVQTNTFSREPVEPPDALLDALRQASSDRSILLFALSYLVEMLSHSRSRAGLDPRGREWRAWLRLLLRVGKTEDPEDPAVQAAVQDLRRLQTHTPTTPHVMRAAASRRVRHVSFNARRGRSRGGRPRGRRGHARRRSTRAGPDDGPPGSRYVARHRGPFRHRRRR